MTAEIHTNTREQNKYAQWAKTHWRGSKRPARVPGTFIGWAILIVLMIGVGAYVATSGLLGRSYSFSGAGGGSLTGCTASGPSLPLSGSITDAQLATALTATTTIDIIIPSITGWTRAYESPTQSGGAWTSHNSYPPCTQFYLHVSSTAGNKYYDALFGPFNAGMSPWTQGATNSCQNCVWAQGTTLALYQETTKANQKWLMVDSLGASCGTATGATADSHTTVQAGNVGANTAILSLSLTLAGITTSSVTNYGIAWPIITPTLAPPGSPGPGTSTLSLVAWYATNSTSGNAWITQNGWTPTTQQPAPTVGTLFYKVLNGVTSTKSTAGTLQLQIPVDLTNGPGAGKRVQTAVWVTDNQLPSDAQNAVTDGPPQALGAYSTVGPSANAFSFTTFTTSNGRWTGYLINCAVTE